VVTREGETPPEEFRDVDVDTHVSHPYVTATAWIGMLLAPAAFLSGMLVNYALSPGPCTDRHLLLIHCVHAVAVIGGIVGTHIAWTTARHAEWGEAPPSILLLTRVGAGIGALFVLAAMLQWAAAFALGGCR
jgi:hypothetical protein